MCLILYRPEGADVPAFVLSSGLDRNRDGWGLIVPQANRQPPRILRGFGRKKLKKILRTAGSAEYLLHLRMATSGLINLDNTHPFEVIPNVWLMHNGIFPFWSKRATGDESDTALFTAMLRETLRGMRRPINWLHSETAGIVLSKLIGNGGKVVLATPRGILAFPTLQRWYEVRKSGVLVSNTYAWTDPEWKVYTAHASGNVRRVQRFNGQDVSGNSRTWYTQRDALTDYDDGRAGLVEAPVDNECCSLCTSQLPGHYSFCPSVTGKPLPEYAS